MDLLFVLHKLSLASLIDSSTVGKIQPSEVKHRLSERSELRLFSPEMNLALYARLNTKTDIFGLIFAQRVLFVKSEGGKKAATMTNEGKNTGCFFIRGKLCTTLFCTFQSSIKARRRLRKSKFFDGTICLGKSKLQLKLFWHLVIFLWSTFLKRHLTFRLQQTRLQSADGRTTTLLQQVQKIGLGETSYKAFSEA